jgi:hypothetical protein
MEPKEETASLREALEFNLTGKIFLAAIGAWLVGKVVNTKIRGNQGDITAVANALTASKKFQEELRRPGATVQSVVDKLRIKQMSAAEFERALGVPWPL